jgi:FkbM family methyltransferase
MEMKALITGLAIAAITVRQLLRRQLLRLRQSHETSARSRRMVHYSQWGEDLVVAKILTADNGFYVDVGCHHPTTCNNTYLLYQRGWTGLCIDAVASFGPFYAETRPRDRFVYSAVSPTEGEVAFYVGNNNALGSLLQSKWIPQKVTVRAKPLRAILEEHQVPRDFAFLSIDVEGTEVEALRSLDFSLFRPRVIVAEYQTMGQINLDLQPFLLGFGYQIISVTRCNVIATNKFTEDWAIKRELAV